MEAFTQFFEDYREETETECGIDVLKHLIARGKTIDRAARREKIGPDGFVSEVDHLLELPDPLALIDTKEHVTSEALRQL